MTGPTRAGSEIPPFEQRVVNVLVDQGWIYVPGHRGNKGKLIPPDPNRPICLVASTPSDVLGQKKWINRLQRSGAQIDNNGNSTVETVRPEVQSPAMPITAVESDIRPISTLGAWWHPAPAEPEPEPAPVVVEQPAPRRAIPTIDPWSKGTHYTYPQALNLILQGYHIKKVVAKTGWGRAHLEHLVGPHGYYEGE